MSAASQQPDRHLVVHLGELRGVPPSDVDVAVVSPLARRWSWPMMSPQRQLPDADAPVMHRDWIGPPAREEVAADSGELAEHVPVHDDGVTDANAPAATESGEAAAEISDADPRVLPEAVFAAACGSCDMQVVRSWLLAGGDVNAQEGARGWTLLMAASVYEHNMLVLELLQRGAATEVRQQRGATALAVASMRGAYRAVELLVEHGADVNAARATDRSETAPRHCLSPACLCACVCVCVRVCVCFGT
jgi:hypothetical protein